MSTKLRLLSPLLAGVCSILLLFLVVGTSPAIASQTGDGLINWYFKEPWPDYAISGVPDFDQKQDGWLYQGENWSHCGPVAAANSVWWFDSKFEPNPMFPLIPDDNYYLVTAYPAVASDHDPINVGGMGPPGLVDDLACYFGTNSAGSGTEVHNLAQGLQQYLYNDPTHPCYIPGRSRGGSYYDDYHVQLVKMPTWEWVVEEVQRSEDVILLLGFWQNYNPPGVPEEWMRLGGHYVTVAGINDVDLQIAFSDPYLDNAEIAGMGNVGVGLIFPHVPIPGHTPEVHNDAGNVSHDFYPVTLMPQSPAGLWEIVGYGYDPNFAQMNTPVEFLPLEGVNIGSPILVEVEYAVAMSPFDWKPGGEWVDVPWEGQWYTEWWGYEDDADSCMPDFGWWEMEPFYDAATAMANSLWWFDSKAETLVTGGWPVPPPTFSDHYYLMNTYGDWDEHAISNTVPFIGDLADNYLHTTPMGTTPQALVDGYNAYMWEELNVARDFYTRTMLAPTFEWVADEVETCEDVVMLLGFYEQMPEGSWERKGGHWVNAAGVSRLSGQIGLSDPAIDHANSESISTTLYTGRVFPPEHIGTPFTSLEKQAPQSISHDIYKIVTGTLPGGAEFALGGYPAEDIVDSFIGLNCLDGTPGFPWTGEPISTVVEWAMGVSPYSDLVITKTTELTEVIPGEWVSYTLQYTNLGLAAVHNVEIVDTLPQWLYDIHYDSYPPIDAAPGFTYTWKLPLLSYGQTGYITVTGRSLLMYPPYNIAFITGTSVIDNPTPDRDLSNNTSHAGQLLLYLPLVMR
jgi:uncharacterized repeat protein (TIGR01451 family)